MRATTAAPSRASSTCEIARGAPTRSSSPPACSTSRRCRCRTGRPPPAPRPPGTHPRSLFSPHPRLFPSNTSGCPTTAPPHAPHTALPPSPSSPPLLRSTPTSYGLYPHARSVSGPRSISATNVSPSGVRSAPSTAASALRPTSRFETRRCPRTMARRAVGPTRPRVRCRRPHRRRCSDGRRRPRRRRRRRRATTTRSARRWPAGSGSGGRRGRRRRTRRRAAAASPRRARRRQGRRRLRASSVTCPPRVT